MTDPETVRQRAQDASRFSLRLDQAADRLVSARKIAEALNERNELLKEKQMADTPKGMQLPNFAGLATAMDKLKASLEIRAQRVLNRAESVDARGAAVEGKAMAFLEATDSALHEYGKQFDAVERVTGDNGAPLDESETR